MRVEDFRKILVRGHRYRWLYHFTDRANLPSIAQHGLLSKHQAEAMGVVVPAPGGNDWSWEADEYKGLEDYVNLCFTTNHPMCYLAHKDGRIPDPFYLGIKPEVLNLEGVKITLDVANKSGVELLDVEEGLEHLDTQVLYTRTDWSDPIVQARLSAAEKCEVLVPKSVPLDLILRK